MKYHTDYYNYELVGIVIHSGTTDSGHYYSYIKEQERFQDAQQEKWFEFNDAVVRDFDKNEIPKECFGGMEQSIGWGMKGFMKTANAYLCVYKRKLFDTPVDSDDESNSIQQTQYLGQQTLNLKSDSPIVKKIAKQNHKYWQNRFLFSKEYTSFVCELTAHWNTNFVIPDHSSDRNDDKHLYPIMGTISQPNEPQSQTINRVNDFSLPLDTLYSKEHVESLQFNVFKFAVSHYISIMQRAENKDNLTTMVKYLKSYINFNTKWASWFLQQFVNADIIKECLFENTNKFMRQILVGLIYCAMIKTYNQERQFLNNFWVDIRNQSQVIRQTVLGSFILLIVSLLPQLKNYNKNQSATLQILSRFSFMGPEARTFMIEAQCIEKLLNFFYWECSPYLEEFKNAPRFPFEINQNPEIGLPTPENLNEKKGRFALIKRTLRQKKLLTDDPHYHYLVETVANLARSIKNQQNKQTKYQIDKQLTQSLGEHDLVLFLPSYEFLEKLFLHSTKPRVIQTLCKAYLHHGQYDELVFQKLWETVQFGLKEYEHHKIRPFLILFQTMVEAKSDTGSSCDQILNDFFRKVIAQGMRFFQWMEVVLDFVWKMYTRMPFVRLWMQSHIESWEFLQDWLEKNKEPPIQYTNPTNQQIYRLNKTRSGQINAQRYNKLFNQSLYYYRQSCLNHMKNKTNMDLSAEIDLDVVCVQDFKFENGMKVDILEDRFNLVTKQAIICTELDEVVNVEVISDDVTQRLTNWILTTKCKLYKQGIIQKLYKFTEIQRISEVLQKRAEMEAQKRIQLEKEQALLQAQQPKSLRGMTGQPQRSNVINTAGGTYYYHNKDSDQDEDEDDDEEDDDMGNKSFEKLPSYDKDQIQKGVNQDSTQQPPQENYMDYNMGDRSFDKQAAANSSFDKDLLQKEGHQNQDDVPNLEHNYSYGKPDSTDQNYDAMNDDIAEDFESGGLLSD